MESLKNNFCFRGSYLLYLGVAFWIWGRVSASAPIFSPPQVMILRLGNCPLINILIFELVRLVPCFRTISSHFEINSGQSLVACPLVLQ
jgi:hypothetical protein